MFRGRQADVDWVGAVAAPYARIGGAIANLDRALDGGVRSLTEAEIAAAGEELDAIAEALAKPQGPQSREAKRADQRLRNAVKEYRGAVDAARKLWAKHRAGMVELGDPHDESILDERAAIAGRAAQFARHVRLGRKALEEAAEYLDAHAA